MTVRRAHQRDSGSASGAMPPGGLSPLAVVGMSFRFPQESTSAEAFWDMLVSKRCTSSDIPAERMNISAFHHPDQSRLDSMAMRGGHFIKGNLGAFDAPFFSIGAAEAEAMDPSQRFMLETTYRAIENAGIPIEQIAGTKTCVYTGCFNNDYAMLLPKDPLSPPKYHTVGTQMSMLANRVSWFFDLTGPSANIDTACSSSLLAMDLVCQSIWAGDSEMGLACGCNVIFNPEFMATMDNLGFLSKDSRCFSFDHRANGYARGEGFGVIVIKPLQRAIDNGDTIRAVIRSSSSNQDGKTPSLTQPSKEAQESLIRFTYRKAGLDMGSTRYFEAHGTGTPVGDPLEIGAIGAVFRHYRSPEEPLYIGSVKSNVGHLEGASGIAGVIKVILALERGIIPPNANFERLNPKIDADFLNIRIPIEAVNWPCKGLRRASVQSFGFGGSNSHVVIEDAYNYLLQHDLKGNHNTVPDPMQRRLHGFQMNLSHENRFGITNGVNSTADSAQRNGMNGSSQTIKIGVDAVQQYQCPTETQVLVWSAADESGIDRLKEIWKQYLDKLPTSQENKETYLRDLAYTLACRRTHFPWRTFAVAKGRDGMHSLIDQLSVPVKAASSPNLAFIFTGQGAQWFAMGRELLYRYPVFRSSLIEAGIYLKTLGCSWDLLDELQKNESESNVNSTEYSQSLCTALQLALVDLLESFKIRPAGVVGHSSGEIAAAYTAKALDRDSALRIAYFRGKLASELGDSDGESKWGMSSVGLSSDGVTAYLQSVSAKLGSTRLNVACVNSPKNLTISGDATHLDYLQALLDHDRVFVRKLKVTVAYHSFQMKAISKDYLACLGSLTSQQPDKSSPIMISSVTGSLVESHHLSKGEYWVKNMLQPVLFTEALSKLCSQSSSSAIKKLDGRHHRMVSVHHLVEIGPHAALQGPARDILRSINQETNIAYTSILRRNVSAVHSALEAAGRLHCAGYTFDLDRVNRPTATGDTAALPKALSTLPEYVFDHTKEYWSESRLSKDSRLRRFGRLDLLGTPSQDWNPLQAQWRNIIRISELPWIDDHKINGATLYPAAGMIVKALEAAKQLSEAKGEVEGFMLKNVAFQSALKIPTVPGSIEVDTYLKSRSESDPKGSHSFDFSICAFDGDKWIENCKGCIQVLYASRDADIDNRNEQQAWHQSHTQTYQDYVRECGTSVDVQGLYDLLSRSGYGYGPTFRPITEMSYDEQEHIISKVALFQWSNYEGASIAQHHVIHPTTFDGIFQTIFAVYTKGGTETMSTAIPTYIDRLWISVTGLSHPGSDSIQVHAQTQWVGLRETSSDIAAFDASGNKVLMEIKGVKTTIISAADASEASEKMIQDKCYNIQWKPDLDLNSIDGVLERYRSTYTEDDEPVVYYQDLHALLAITIKDTHDRIKTNPSTSFADSPHMRRYMNWLDRQVKQLELCNSSASAPNWSLRAENETLGLIQRIASASGQGSLYVSIVQRLGEILEGKVDVSDVLSRDLIESHFSEICQHLKCFRGLGNYIDAYVHKHPAFKFLQFGVGSTAMIDQLMNTYVNYENGSDNPRYARHSYPRMQPKAVDIELDMQAQGFEAGSYDVIFCSMISHTTTNMTVALRNCHKLLRPGGKLILLDNMEPDALPTGFIFGLLESWWFGSEGYRQDSPCMNKMQWNELLLKTGFSGSEIELDDFKHPICHAYSVIISTKLPPTPATTPARASLVILHGPDQAQQDQADKVKSDAEAKGLSAHLASLQLARDISLDPDTVVISLLELHDPVWLDISPELFEILQKLLTHSPRLIWVSRRGGFHSPEPNHHIVDGLLRVLQSELMGVTLVSFALETDGYINSNQRESILQLANSMILNEGLDTEYVEDQGLLQIPRLTPASRMNTRLYEYQATHQRRNAAFGGGIPLRLDIGTAGLPDKVHFVEDSVGRSTELKPYEIEIHVMSAGFGFREVLMTQGRLGQRTLGTECAGIVTRCGKHCEDLGVGTRVAAVCLDSFRSFARVDCRSAVRIPDNIPFSTAVAIPFNFGTAWYSLKEVARVSPGETVLIHSGAGATGQAAIQVALHLGAVVFTTVSSEKKKQFIIDRYGIQAEHIFSSRGIAFSGGIKRLTQGAGADVILNSLSGEGLAASWECIAPYGRFIELGKKDIASHSKLSMSFFEKNVTFRAVDIPAMSLERPQVVRKALEDVLPLVESKVLRPAGPLHVFGVSEMENAFRTMQSRDNIGKVVVEFRPEDMVNVVLEARPSFQFSCDATYIIAGGLGGLGRCVSRWFVERGARYLILLSRAGAQSTEAQGLIAELTRSGARIKTPACDIADRDALRIALHECLTDMPAVRGCIQSSMVLRDGMFESLTFESWKESTLPKIQGSWNLHSLLPDGIDFFVLFSSISAIIGNRGQSNYAAGNTFQDALAQYRVSKGERAASINLGLFLSAGVISEDKSLLGKFRARSFFNPMTEPQLFALLDYYCNPAESYANSLDCQTIVHDAATDQPNTDVAHWLTKPLFRKVLTNMSNRDTGTASTDVVNVQTAFSSASSLSDAGAVVKAALVKKLADILSLPPEELDASQPMHSYGVDSLVAVDLRNWLAKELQVDFAIFDILGSTSIAAVSLLAAARSKYCKVEWTE